MINAIFRNLLHWMLAAGILLTGLSGVIAQACASTMDSYDGRQMIVHVPDRLPPSGSRALVVVLHGGLGNAQRIAGRQAESGLNMDAVADRNGFIVVYLNGTPVTRWFGSRFLGWNAGGGCCGMSAANNVDDVAYIKGAVATLAGWYGIDRARVYGIGHSNGAMMSQRVACETHLFAAVVAISGPLNLQVSSCPAARGTRILALHGANDQNVPVAGGQGSKGLSFTAFNSEDRSRRIFLNSGATYTLQIVPGADHPLDHIEAAIMKTEGVTIAEKSARFFGLLKSRP
ncbi:alpha/beta hydrolase family esterase [Labrys okinawensis]|uniref:alpha/beta hydrolase family esterase n=1 Tax=Labrys okinawensis TaxID=346911 RepID=UPI0039BCC668